MRESAGQGVVPKANEMLSHTRRECLMALGAAAVAAWSPLVGASTRRAKPMRGVFIILNTPFTATGAVDWDDLRREVAFVDRGGCHGIVWPQGSSGVTTLTKDERVRGMQVLAKATQDSRLTLVLGVQGKDTSEMLEYAERAEALGTDAMIAMPPTWVRLQRTTALTFARWLARLNTRSSSRQAVVRKI